MSRFTTETLKPSCDQKVFPQDKFGKAGKAQGTFAEKPQMNINSVKKQKFGYLN